MEIEVIVSQVKKDIKKNRYDKSKNVVVINGAQEFAIRKLRQYYLDIFIDKNESSNFPPVGYISSRQEVQDLSDFFYWGAWYAELKEKVHHSVIRIIGHTIQMPVIHQHHQ